MAKLALLLAMAVSLLGCDSAPKQPAPDTPAPRDAAPDIPKGWVRLEAGTSFSFQAPEDLREIPVQPIDSFVRRYEGRSLDLSFNYGWHSNPLKRIDGQEPDRVEWVVIDGKKAKLVVGGERAGVHFTVVESRKLAGRVTVTRLTMTARLKTDDAQEMALKIFKSIRFIEQDNESGR